eukprot:CCRYP_016356-RA/>CCRYP_016356-RA protein AED:0.24 eAED:-0.46 QI:0/-1/0/1/-1/1/1/0/93
MQITSIIILSATAVSAFHTGPIFPQAASKTSLGMGGFLEGKGKRITVREDEDAAMWFDDGSGGQSSAGPKKPEPKKPVKSEPKKGGFKFPWEK